MQTAETKSGHNPPEQLLRGVRGRLRQHALWDALLLFLPPLATLVYCLVFLLVNDWISLFSAAAFVLLAIALAVLAIVVSYRPHVPSITSAARMIDHRIGAQDRFLTLATLSSPPAPATLVSRLRLETARLQNRITIKRDFRYKMDRKVYPSLLISVLTAVLFPLVLPLADSTRHPVRIDGDLRELADRMARRPNLEQSARSLRNLATKLDDPSVPQDEKRELIHEERQKIEQDQRRQADPEDRDLLSQAAGTLQGVEQQAGQGEGRKDQAGGGGIEATLPQQARGEGTSDNQSGSGSKDNLTAQLDNNMQPGKKAEPKPEKSGKAQSSSADSSGNAHKAEPDQSSKDQRNERAGKTDAAQDRRGGRSKSSEEIPQGAPPAERLYKPGEGEYQGIKGAGYVTVQLPEQLAGQGKGTRQKRDGQGGTAGNSQIPVSNVPLPKHVPDAPTEKQQMPLEYRAIIR
jgi:hypothetical protein